ncbi:hypothetical protein M1N58_00850 [Dehalococcoidales bacterium]|nr:hypothetical protein [Dehalococcoidales bacterium]
MEELYKTLGDAKCVELSKKSRTFWEMLGLGEGRKSAQVSGAVREGIAKEFIKEFLPQGFGLKSGLVFDTETRKMSPQIDAVIYKGVPLLEFGDIVVVEKEQVKGIFEIKSYLDAANIFGNNLASGYRRKKDFLPTGTRYILFAFDLFTGKSDDEVLERLNEVCDSYAIVLRWEPRIELRRGKENWVYNFDNSVSRLIEWLRNLS